MHLFVVPLQSKRAPKKKRRKTEIKQTRRKIVKLRMRGEEGAVSTSNGSTFMLYVWPRWTCALWHPATIGNIAICWNFEVKHEQKRRPVLIAHTFFFFSFLCYYFLFKLLWCNQQKYEFSYFRLCNVYSYQSFLCYAFGVIFYGCAFFGNVGRTNNGQTERFLCSAVCPSYLKWFYDGLAVVVSNNILLLLFECRLSSCEATDIVCRISIITMNWWSSNDDKGKIDRRTSTNICTNIFWHNSHPKRGFRHFCLLNVDDCSVSHSKRDSHLLTLCPRCLFCRILTVSELHHSRHKQGNVLRGNRARGRPNCVRALAVCLLQPSILPLSLVHKI